MSKQIKQFRYYGDGNERNYPSGLSAEDLINGSIFQEYFPVTQLGIQTLPGVKFYLNDLNRQHGAIIGYTGIFELDLPNTPGVSSLSFDEAVQNTRYLIIDIIYEKGGV